MKAQYRFPFPHQFIPQWNKINFGGWDDPVATVHPYWAYDFEIPEGTEVRAARSGTVLAAVGDRVKGEADRETGSGGGNFVLITHFDGTVASYAHLLTGRVFVGPTDYVAQGQIIALSGFTGRAGGPHLHFQVMMWGIDEMTLGPTIPMLFEDAVHDVWKPVAGEVHRSNNTVLRQDNWRWCHKCHLLFFAGAAPPAGPVGSCPAGGGGHDGSASAGYVLALSEPTHEAQPGWRWCSNCSALVFGDTPPPSCPGHGQHLSGSGGYFVRFGATAPSAQPGWRWCANCHGLFLGGPDSVCAATTGPHSAEGSGQYVVDQVLDLHHVVQPNWLWCRKCQGLFFGGNPGSVCPLDKQAHDGSQSSAYTLPLEAAQSPGQPGWRWCNRCQGLFFGGNLDSLCPATSGPHSGTDSGHYALHLDLPNAPGQPGWRWCDRCQGLFFGDTLDSVCPTGQPHSQAQSGNYTIW